MDGRWLGRRELGRRRRWIRRRRRILGRRRELRRRRRIREMVRSEPEHRRQRIAIAFTGVLLALAALAFLVRVGHPELGAEPEDGSWAPIGIHALAGLRGLLGILGALAALACFVIALRPPRRSTPATFFTADERATIQSAIASAEDRTSGEIRVHLEQRTPGEPLLAAQLLFDTLGMTRTEARNGVLVYISVEDHKFAILGDEGIHRVVPEGFWDEAIAGMKARFQENCCAQGVIEAVQAVGEKLHRFFPVQRGDRDELPDEISYGGPPPERE
jgi:uncharacterized membrane protein